MNESQLESVCLDWFRGGDWEVIHRPDMAPESGHKLERDDCGQVMVVIDRSDLDGQLFTTFCQAKDLLRQEPV